MRLEYDRLTPKANSEGDINPMSGGGTERRKWFPFSEKGEDSNDQRATGVNGFTSGKRIMGE